MLVSKYKHQLQPKKTTTGKKGTVVWPAMFFKPPEKKYDWKKKYSHLTDGGNKTQITVCRVTPITTGKNNDRNNKRYNTVIWLSVVSKYEHHQSHFNLRKFLLGFFILQKQLDPNFLLLRISFLLCMDLQPYSHDHFSKKTRALFDFLNNTYCDSLF